jgi:Sulfotransferase family
VMFVGQPRTGHSLVGALLDAHPNALIAHELDALKYVAAGFDRRRLFALLVRAEQARIAAGHLSSTGYQYLVDGQWQGRYERLQVLGDKEGGRSTVRLGEDIGLLDRLRATVGVDVHVVQVVRNPFDVIATMHRRAPKRELSDVVDLFFELADTVDQVQSRVDPDRFHALHHDALIADPAGTLSGLCRFLDLPAPAGYLDACSAIVFDTPRRTRGEVAWTPALLERVAARSAVHPSLEQYRFDDQATSAETSP